MGVPEEMVLKNFVSVLSIVYSSSILESVSRSIAMLAGELSPVRQN